MRYASCASARPPVDEDVRQIEVAVDGAQGVEAGDGGFGQGGEQDSPLAGRQAGAVPGSQSSILTAAGDSARAMQLRRAAPPRAALAEQDRLGSRRCRRRPAKGVPLVGGLARAGPEQHLATAPEPRLVALQMDFSPGRRGAIRSRLRCGGRPGLVSGWNLAGGFADFRVGPAE